MRQQKLPLFKLKQVGSGQLGPDVVSGMSDEVNDERDGMVIEIRQGHGRGLSLLFVRWGGVAIGENRFPTTRGTRSRHQLREKPRAAMPRAADDVFEHYKSVSPNCAWMSLGFALEPLF